MKCMKRLVSALSAFPSPSSPHSFVLLAGKLACIAMHCLTLKVNLPGSALDNAEALSRSVPRNKNHDSDDERPMPSKELRNPRVQTRFKGAINSSNI